MPRYLDKNKESDVELKPTTISIFLHPATEDATSKANAIIGDDPFANIEDDLDSKSTSSRKIDNEKHLYTILEGYWKNIEEYYPKNEDKFMKQIARYRNRHLDQLSTIYPYSQPIFGDDDTNIIYEVTNIDKSDIAATIKKVIFPSMATPVEKKNFKPELCVLLMIARYYLKKQDPKKFNMTLRYLGYAMYWSVYYKYFHFNPRRETLEYTIDRLDNKFIIKQLQSVDALIMYCVSKCVRNNYAILDDGFDTAFAYIIDAIKGSMNGKMFKIYQEYKKDYDSGNIQFTGKDYDSSTSDVRSVAADVESAANKYTSKFFSNDVNAKIIRYCAESCAVSPQELRAVLRRLIDLRLVEEVKQFYQCAFQLYFTAPEGDGNLENRQKFLVTMQQIYRRGNTKNPNDLKMKELLSDWLEKGSTTYSQTTRAATKGNYKKAIYQYFAFLVALNN